MIHEVTLIDGSGTTLAVARVSEHDGGFRGTIDLNGTPPELRAVFEEFEEIVNGQMFSVLDEIEEKLNALPIRAILDGDSPREVGDLQVYPGTGDVSFRLPTTELHASRPSRSAHRERIG